MPLMLMQVFVAGQFRTFFFDQPLQLGDAPVRLRICPASTRASASISGDSGKASTRSQRLVAGQRFPL